MKYIINKSIQNWSIPYLTVPEYIVDTGRPFGGYQQGDILCSITLFDIFDLHIGIRQDGSLIFRSWKKSDKKDPVLQVYMAPYDKERLTPTEAQFDTVAGLFSGRITFEGIRLEVGDSLKRICPIDYKKEEKRIGKKLRRR